MSLFKKCTNNIFEDGLLMNIDISNNNSWDLNLNLKTDSLKIWGGSTISDNKLCDYGLTMFDVGRVDDMNKTIEFTPNNKFHLEPIKYNEVSGNTITTITPPISGVTDINNGNYFMLNGGYLNNFFKLQDYNYQVLPIRFNNGFTIETKIEILENSSGMFYFMGTRSEDKYNEYFTGETYNETVTEELTVRIGGMGQTETQNIEKTVYNGVKSSNGNLLYSLKNVKERKKAFNDFANAFDDILIDVDQNENISNNALGFFITENKNIGYRYINTNGLIVDDYSNDNIQTGWTNISITYKPYNIIDNYDYEKELCYERRNGDLIFYINGRKFWKIENFPEFYYKPIQNNKEKVIGVPYNISWGGGSFGLEHSYHYDYVSNHLYNSNDQNYINDNFRIIEEDDSCVNDVILSENNSKFTNSVLELIHTGDTGTTCNYYYFEYYKPIVIYPNREYEISIDSMFDNVFQDFSNFEISLLPYGTDDLDVMSDVVINEFKYKNGEWNTSTIKIITNDKCEKHIINVGIIIKSNRNLIDNFKIYFNNFKIVGSDYLVQDSNKQNLIIQKNFNESFIGNIQKLRFYDKSLNSRIILNNANIDNPNTITKGGRIINRL